MQEAAIHESTDGGLSLARFPGKAILLPVFVPDDETGRDDLPPDFWGTMDLTGAGGIPVPRVTRRNPVVGTPATVLGKEGVVRTRPLKGGGGRNGLLRSAHGR